jgi:hypothetical protein
MKTLGAGADFQDILGAGLQFHSRRDLEDVFLQPYGFEIHGLALLITRPGTEGWRDKERRARVKACIEELGMELVTYGEL